jgi:cation diffusion facilitator CzcD-associated flavoprotein CzcO
MPSPSTPGRGPDKSNGNDSLPGRAEFDAIVVGAGWAGMYMLHRLRQLGLSCRVYEAGAGVGGVWHWNRYPGARTDGEWMWYSYSFSPELEQEWNWTERLPGQPELERYANHVADRFDLRGDIQLNTRVVGAHFDSSVDRWYIETEHGERAWATYLVTAAGALSATNIPDFKGLAGFEGECYHTSRWPREEVSFEGKRVGVIGTGSSGVQCIPVIAREAAHLFVFQRTANFTAPAWNVPTDPQFQRSYKEDYPAHRQRQRDSVIGVYFAHANREQSALQVSPEERRETYEQAWLNGPFTLMSSYNDLGSNLEANQTLSEFMRDKVRQLVRDPEVAELLVPTAHPIGTKRLCIDIGYYETFNRDNVTLVDVASAPIEEITARGLRTTAAEYDLDTIVLATGFDAMTGALERMGIHGRSGLALTEKWREGPVTYLGLATAGFPNLFMITGPGSPSVLGNNFEAIEQHVEWISDCLGFMRDHGIQLIEATPEAEQSWGEHVRELAGRTLHHLADTWYNGKNIPGKKGGFTAYSGGYGTYRRECDEVVANGYVGFSLTTRRTGSYMV